LQRRHMSQERPIKDLACAPRFALDIRVKQEGTRPGVSRARLKRLRVLDAESFNHLDKLGKPADRLRRLRTVELYGSQAELTSGLEHLRLRSVEKHPDRCHKRRQRGDDLAGLLQTHPAGAFAKDEPDGVGAHPGGQVGVLGPGNPAHLDADNPPHAAGPSPAKLRSLAATSGSRVSASPINTASTPSSPK